MSNYDSVVKLEEIFEMIEVEDTIYVLTVVATIATALQAFLITHKIWVRKHIEDVACSVSVTGQLVGIIVSIPYLLYFLFVLNDMLLFLRPLIVVVAGVFLVMIGLRIWIGDLEEVTLAKRLGFSLRNEAFETVGILKRFGKPKDASAILETLKHISVIDNDFHKNEKSILQNIGEHWGISEDLLAHEDGYDLPARVEKIMESVHKFLAAGPSTREKRNFLKLIEHIIRADGVVLENEKLIYKEISITIESSIQLGRRSYSSNDVIIVPQNLEQVQSISNILNKRKACSRYGGHVFEVGSYFCNGLAELLCEKYRSAGFFTIVISTPTNDS